MDEKATACQRRSSMKIASMLAHVGGKENDLAARVHALVERVLRKRCVCCLSGAHTSNKARHVNSWPSSLLTKTWLKPAQLPISLAEKALVALILLYCGALFSL
jgi:hypothetical protein